MKKTVRQYPKGCDWCNATGMVQNTLLPLLTYDACPVCSGSGVITVTETIMEHDDIHEPTTTHN